MPKTIPCFGLASDPIEYTASMENDDKSEEKRTAMQADLPASPGQKKQKEHAPGTSSIAVAGFDTAAFRKELLDDLK
eukprot:3166282-Amphidinium_carterae.1